MRNLAELTTMQAIGIVFLLGLTAIATVYIYGAQQHNDVSGQYCSEHGCLLLQDDGSFIVEQDHPFSGEYIVKGDQITLYYSFGKFEAEINGNTIVDGDGDVWIKI